MAFSGKIRKALLGWLVEDVPASIHACESCRRVDCTLQRMADCPLRVAAEEQQSPARHHDARVSAFIPADIEPCPESVPAVSQTRPKRTVEVPPAKVQKR